MLIFKLVSYRGFLERVQYRYSLDATNLDSDHKVTARLVHRIRAITTMFYVFCQDRSAYDLAVWSRYCQVL